MTVCILANYLGLPSLMMWLESMWISLAANTKVVGIFRSEESAKKTSARLDNPPEDKFVPIVGSVGKYLAALQLQARPTTFLYSHRTRWC